MIRSLSSRVLVLAVVSLPSVLFFGCGSEPPEPTQEAIEKEMQQLDQHREREWNNE